MLIVFSESIFIVIFLPKNIYTKISQVLKMLQETLFRVEKERIQWLYFDLIALYINYS